METTGPDCEGLRRRRAELQARLDELRAEESLARPLTGAASALGRLAGAVRSLAGDAGDVSAKADRLLSAARLAAAALVDLLGGSRANLVDAPALLERVQDAVAKVTAAVERIERAFVAAEGAPTERLAATRGFVVDLSAALEGLDAVPGLRDFLDDAARALELMAAWTERVEKLRRRPDGGPAELPAIGPGMWPFGEREEPAAAREMLELRIARLDHDLLACGDRPGGPACVDCGDDPVDRVIGELFDDAASRAKEKAADLAGSSADLVACRTALRRRRDLDQDVVEKRWELQDAVRRRHTRKAAVLRQELDRLLLERRRAQRLMPSHVSRYRQASAAYRRAVRDWRDAAGERLREAAEAELWDARELGHLTDCHPSLPPPSVARAPDLLPPRPPVHRARRRAVASLVAAAAVVLVAAALLTLGGPSDDEEPVAAVGSTT